MQDIIQFQQNAKNKQFFIEQVDYTSKNCFILVWSNSNLYIISQNCCENCSQERKKLKRIDFWHETYFAFHHPALHNLSRPSVQLKWEKLLTLLKDVMNKFLQSCYTTKFVFSLEQQKHSNFQVLLFILGNNGKKS